MKSSGEVFRFGDFTLDPANRVLTRDGAPLAVGARYFDALLLLVRAAGDLVTKDRLLDEVWRGVPVTDEAVTQCIRTLRRTLGDDASAPCFIETVPKHGYRFVARVRSGQQDREGRQDCDAPRADVSAIFRWLALAGSGGLGGAVAGAAIGLVYGLVLADGAQAQGMGISFVAVIVCCGALAGLFSALAIAAGVATADRWTRFGRARWVLGAAGGGLLGGTALNMLSRDMAALIFGRQVANLPGSLEGAGLGLAVAIALLWARHAAADPMTGWAGMVVPGILAGASTPLLGGTLFAGSLAAVSAAVPGSPFAMSPSWLVLSLGRSALAGAFEGAVFCTAVAAAMLRGLRPSIRSETEEREPSHTVDC